MKGPRHVILDRDGVLNIRTPDGAPIDVGRWSWEPGALEALRFLSQSGVRISVATNQSCIARGSLNRAGVDAVHERLCREAERAGAHIAAVYVCPHRPSDGCGCRKPAPGLLLRALRESGVGASETLFVGDDVTDLQAGRAANVPVALVRTGKGKRTEETSDAAGTPIFDSLADAARWVIEAP